MIVILTTTIGVSLLTLGLVGTSIEVFTLKSPLGVYEFYRKQWLIVLTIYPTF